MQETGSDAEGPGAGGATVKCVEVEFKELEFIDPSRMVRPRIMRVIRVPGPLDVVCFWVPAPPENACSSGACALK